MMNRKKILKEIEKTIEETGRIVIQNVKEMPIYLRLSEKSETQLLAKSLFPEWADVATVNFDKHFRPHISSFERIPYIEFSDDALQSVHDAVMKAEKIMLSFKYDRIYN